MQTLIQNKEKEGGGGEEGREGEMKGEGSWIQAAAESDSTPGRRDGIGKGEKIHNVLTTLAADAI